MGYATAIVVDSGDRRAYRIHTLLIASVWLGFIGLIYLHEWGLGGEASRERASPRLAAPPPVSGRGVLRPLGGLDLRLSAHGAPGPPAPVPVARHPSRRARLRRGGRGADAGVAPQGPPPLARPRLPADGLPDLRALPEPRRPTAARALYPALRDRQPEHGGGRQPHDPLPLRTDRCPPDGGREPRRRALRPHRAARPGRWPGGAGRPPARGQPLRELGRGPALRRPAPVYLQRRGRRRPRGDHPGRQEPLGAEPGPGPRAPRPLRPGATGHAPVLASAFQVREIPYWWKKGVVERWPG